MVSILLYYTRAETSWGSWRSPGLPRSLLKWKDLATFLSWCTICCNLMAFYLIVRLRIICGRWCLALYIRIAILEMIRRSDTCTPRAYGNSDNGLGGDSVIQPTTIWRHAVSPIFVKPFNRSDWITSVLQAWFWWRGVSNSIRLENNVQWLLAYLQSYI